MTATSIVYLLPLLLPLHNLLSLTLPATITLPTVFPLKTLITLPTISSLPSLPTVITVSTPIIVVSIPITPIASITSLSSLSPLSPLSPVAPVSSISSLSPVTSVPSVSPVSLSAIASSMLAIPLSSILPILALALIEGSFAGSLSILLLLEVFPALLSTTASAFLPALQISRIPINADDAIVESSPREILNSNSRLLMGIIST